MTVIKFGGYTFDVNKWKNQKTGNVPAVYEPTAKTEFHPGTQIPARYPMVASGYPCPIPGCDDGVLHFDYDGRRAIWDAGNVYLTEA